jgi:hypothetical protein
VTALDAVFLVYLDAARKAVEDGSAFDYSAGLNRVDGMQFVTVYFPATGNMVEPGQVAP